MEQRIVIRSTEMRDKPVTDEEWWTMGVRFQGQDFVLSQALSLPCRLTTTTQNQSTISQAYLYPSCIPRPLFIHPLLPTPPFPSSPGLLLAALRLRGVSGEFVPVSTFVTNHSTSLTQLPNVLSLTSRYFLYRPHLACAYSATFRIAPQQVNARILRIHRIERYPI